MGSIRNPPSGVEARVSMLGRAHARRGAIVPGEIPSGHAHTQTSLFSGVSRAVFCLSYTQQTKPRQTHTCTVHDASRSAVSQTLMSARGPNHITLAQRERTTQPIQPRFGVAPRDRRRHPSRSPAHAPPWPGWLCCWLVGECCLKVACRVCGVSAETRCSVDCELETCRAHNETSTTSNPL